MSQEKINYLSLAEQLAHKADVTRKEAEDFLRLFASVLEDALLTQEPVKVKGFGTLKPQWNAARKSVDVNTGEEITLAGYFKINFAPEAALKEAINEPYAHLEPVILPGGEENEARKTVVKEPDLPVSESKEEVPAANLDYFSEQASEIKGILSEINAIGKREEEKEDVHDDLVEEQPDIREIDEADTQENVAIAADSPSEDASKVKDEVYAKQQNPDSVAQVKEANRKNQSVFPMLLLGIVIGVALVYILSYLNILPGLKLPVYYPEEEKIVAVIPEPELLPDTVLVNEIVEEEPIDSLQLLFDTPREYKDFISSEKVIPGSRLTRIAERHYGVKLFWIFIYEANREKIPDPENVPVGIVLKIPRLDPVLADPNNERCMNYLLDLQNKYLKK
jgi:nucleoid DNA-binding protein/nucleoid-associated protein YgaU